MNDSSQPNHLIIVEGPEVGRELHVPESGARIGRVEGNDIVSADPSMSRFQCRFFFKNKELWITDLGSTNTSLVNSKEVHEAHLRKGDLVTLGETILRVIYAEGGTGTQPETSVSSAPPPPPVSAPAPAAAPAAPGTGESIDLGLGAGNTAAEASAAATPRKGFRKLLWLTAVGMVCLLGIAALVKQVTAPVKPDSAAAPVEDKRTLEIHYEKVQASENNIFRYNMSLKDNVVEVQMNDLGTDRHLTKREAVEEEVVEQLRAQLEGAGYESLQELYEGISSNIYDVWDLSITIGRETHRTVVRNRMEPEVFREVREDIEEFSRTAVGIFTQALPPERLKELAREAFLEGRKRYDERSVKYDNLFLSIRAFGEVEWYLETIEPKPDYYKEAIVSMQQARQELQETYEDQEFRSQRAIKLRDWETAARHLRIICEMIPDRADERHKKAQRRLLEVEKRLDK